MGTTIREILEGHAGGMRDGYAFRALLPGGASTQFLAEQHLDVAMDFTSVEKAGSRLGTGTMIIVDDRTCPVGLLHNLQHFFARSLAAGARPVAMDCPGSSGSLARSKPDTVKHGILRFWKCIPASWAPAKPSARWHRAPWSLWQAA